MLMDEVRVLVVFVEFFLLVVRVCVCVCVCEAFHPREIQHINHVCDTETAKLNFVASRFAQPSSKGAQ